MEGCKHKELIFVSINFAEFMETEAEFEAVCKCYKCGRIFKVKGMNLIESEEIGDNVDEELKVAVEFKIVE